MKRSIFKYHPVIGHNFIPGIKARVMNENGAYLVMTNNLGFRCNHNAEPEKPEGKKRVIFFGDSYVAGDGVRNEERFTDRIEKMLDRDVEALNFGLPGSGTDQQYLAYKEFAQNLEKDLLVIVALVENIKRIMLRYRAYREDSGGIVYYAKPYYTIEKEGLVLHHQPVPKRAFKYDEIAKDQIRFTDKSPRALSFSRAVNNCAGFKEAMMRLGLFEQYPEYHDRENEAWPLMEAILAEWIKGAGTKVLLVPLPTYHFVEGFEDPSHYQERFRELKESAGCEFYDPLGDLRKYGRKEARSFRFAKDPHPTSRGHEALANSLAPVISKLLKDT